MRNAVKAGEDIATRRSTKRHTILFLAANPHGTDQLALDREARSIHMELKRSGYRDRFAFETRWAAEPLDLLRELRELKPTVVHFSGHGGSRLAGVARPAQWRDVVSALAPSGSDTHGLYFHDAAGSAQVVSPEAIARTLNAAGTSVKLVVLNGCFTEPIAEALLAHVDCIVGMTGSIHDDAARTFAIGLYGGLGEHESIAAAFEQGKAAIDLDGLPDADRPQLKVRAGFDAGQLILAAVTPVLRLDVPCPYPGMRPFTKEDAASFHGRDAQIDDLIDRLRTGEREIYVIGPSGSGKSSLVAAGVLPRLARGVAGLGPAVVRTLRPGEQPAVRLSEALNVSSEQPFAATEAIGALLAHRSLGSWVLIVIDQLEELFTQATVSERDAFLAGLRALRGEHRCAVIVTLRADFFGALMESPLWPERLRDQLSRIEVSPLRGEALREAITAPARDAGVAVDPELIERLLADAASEPGTLPLLQETMVQLWNKRTDQTLTLADYQALGDGARSGLAVAIARRADATLRRFNAAQTGISRRILLRLISFGEGRSDTRRQQPRARLHAAGDDATDFAFVLHTMVNARLLTIDEDVSGEPRADLAHEIMIAAWPRLAEWIRSHRADEQQRRQIEAAATLWVEHGRGIRGLLDLVELADAEQWQRTESAVQLGHSDDVMAMIAASRTAQTKQRRRRRVVVGAVGLLGLIAVAVAAAFVAAREQTYEARRFASEAEHLASANHQLIAQSYAETGRQLLVDHHFQEAVPYLLAARQGGKDSPPLRMLFREAKQHLPLIPALEHEAGVISAVFSPDGTRVVTASRDNTARVWDAATGKPLTGMLEHQGAVWSAAFSPDGTRVVTASKDKTARVWDVATGQPLTGALEHQEAVESAVFSPDGTRVVTASWDNTARVWEAATGKPLTGALEHQGIVRHAAFSPDGTRVVTASDDETARVWDAVTGKPLTRPLEHQGDVVSAAFSPDGTRVATASRDGIARVWDATTGRPITRGIEDLRLPQVQRSVFSADGTRFRKTAIVWRRSPWNGAIEHQQDVVGAAFSPDGTRVVTASDDHTARIWNAATAEPVSSALEHRGRVSSAAFSPDGARVVTASDDHTARVWNAATAEPVGSALEHQQDVVSAMFSPDGARVITASDDHTARVWDALAGKRLICVLRHRGVVSAAFSPDGARVVTANESGEARVWSAATCERLTSALKHQRAVVSTAFSSDGTRVVTASEDKTARVWDAATGKPLAAALEHQGIVWSAAFSPDGTRVVTASGDNSARVWAAATGKPLTSALEHQEAVVSTAFSPDGTRVVTASWDKTARVWNAATGKPLTGALEHRGRVMSAAFSPDGTRVVTASEDNTARVWDVATGKPVTAALEHREAVVSAVFSLDGTRFVTASWDGTARVWDAVTGKPLTSALEHRSRVLSAAFSPDGTRVVTAGLDDTARVWDAATGRPLTGALEHAEVVTSAAFSPDGTRMLTVSRDHAARVWDVSPDMGTLADWERIAERSPFVLVNGVLVRRSETRADATRGP